MLKITRRDGGVAELREEALVAGKVVPGPPPVRRSAARARGTTAPGARATPPRPSSGRALVEIAARGWPGTETERLAGWTLRAAGGFTARANSALPPASWSDPDDVAEEAAASGAGGTSAVPRSPGVDGTLDGTLGRIRHWYAERGLPARIQLTTEGPGADPALDAALAQRGWTPERPALVLVGELTSLTGGAPDHRVTLRREPDADWLARYDRAEGLSGPAREVLTGGPSVWFATLRDRDASELTPDDGEFDEGTSPPPAIGRCVVDDADPGDAPRWAGFAALAVDPDHRRRGLASAVLAELARRARAEGASAAYLQVTPDSSAALNLYRGLGFTTYQRYHYRTAPRG
ncbi:GNAT family N-acetyltransferase [Streptomyces sp. AJS327]|uniref:GNAT family N-acetyltransferase n=1 Tax=Streptomyces sp. AJS327 TaxID=2545265 RepID=UPI0035B517B5